MDSPHAERGYEDVESPRSAHSADLLTTTRPSGHGEGCIPLPGNGGRRESGKERTMPTPLEMFDALREATKGRPAGETFKINLFDGLSLGKLTAEDLASRGIDI